LSLLEEARVERKLIFAFSLSALHVRVEDVFFGVTVEIELKFEGILIFFPFKLNGFNH
jgi:hypothetical protein